MVHYQGTRFHPRLGIDHQLLTTVEFMALLVPHVLLKYVLPTVLCFLLQHFAIGQIVQAYSAFDFRLRDVAIHLGTQVGMRHE